MNNVAGVDDRLIIAIDTADVDAAYSIVHDTRELCRNYKFGLTFFSHNSMTDVAEMAKHFGCDVMIDQKFKDIPTQVAGAVASLTELSFVRYATIHIDGGRAMLLAAIEAANGNWSLRIDRLKLLGITVLTSLDENDLQELGIAEQDNVLDQVLRLDKLATEVKLPGRVCAVNEVGELRKVALLSDNASKILVTPGITLGESNSGQKRSNTPGAAIYAGATHIVVGRYITAHQDRAARQTATQEIIADMDGKGIVT